MQMGKQLSRQVDSKEYRQETNKEVKQEGNYLWTDIQILLYILF